MLHHCGAIICLRPPTSSTLPTAEIQSTFTLLWLQSKFLLKTKSLGFPSNALQNQMKRVSTKQGGWWNMKHETCSPPAAELSSSRREESIHTASLIYQTIWWENSFTFLRLPNGLRPSRKTFSPQLMKWYPQLCWWSELKDPAGQ